MGGLPKAHLGGGGGKRRGTAAAWLRECLRGLAAALTQVEGKVPHARVGRTDTNPISGAAPVRCVSEQTFVITVEHVVADILGIMSTSALPI